jgi:polyhydroxybutyrate depolymerase
MPGSGMSGVAVRFSSGVTRRLLALVLLLSAALSGVAAASTVSSTTAAPSGAAGSTSVVSMTYGGLPRTYRLFVPTALPAGPRPLAVMLHGLGSSATLMENRNEDLGAAAAGAVVAYPEGWKASWNGGTCCGDATLAGLDDVGFLAAVIADVKSRLLIDPARVLIGGHSNGGMMAYRFACERADLITAAYVVATSLLTRPCTPSRPFSLLHVHGLADPTVPYAGAVSSGLAGIPIPDVASGVVDVATGVGCSTAFTTTAYNGRTDVNDYAMSGCPSGISVDLVRSKYMTHSWAVSATDIAKFGVDPTAMLWAFTKKVWPASAPSGLVSEAAVTGGRTSVVSLTVGGVARSYRLFVPAALPSGPRPLAVLLHASGSTAALMEAKGTDNAAGYVAYPEGIGGTWNAGPCCSTTDDVAFLAAVVADVRNRVLVSKVAVGGHALGGSLAYRFACERSDLVSAAFVVGTANFTAACAPSQPVSVLHVNGLADTTTPWNGTSSTASYGVAVPSVGASLLPFVTAAGCSSPAIATASASRTDVVTYAFGCPAGISVSAVQSKKMTHSWPLTATEVSTTGVAPSTLLWSWLPTVLA